ncbi:MAG TPA: hypothetical protein VNJ52_09265 [Patescibacteria group bacterium]|nr:hypothetical protein [Patescibacteria group bacterium]
MCRKKKLKMGVTITIDAEYFTEGSLLRGDRKSGVDSLHVNVAVESDEPPEVVASALKEAEVDCFTLGAIRHAHPITVVGNLNGAELKLAGGQAK